MKKQRTPTDRLRRSQQTPGPKRRGSIYVVATSGLVMVGGIGLAAMAILRADYATHTGINETSELRQLAQSGLELALQRMVDAGNNWRNDYRPLLGWRWTIAGAEIVVTASDPVDGNITNSIFDDVVLTAWAIRGDARQGIRVRLEMHEGGGPIYNYSFATRGDLSVRAVNPFTAPQGIYTMGSFIARNYSRINGNVIAGGSIDLAEGSVVSGVTRSNAPAVDFPDADAAFDIWIARATPINPALLIDGYIMSSVTLSPTENPYGDVNPDGIYHLHGTRPDLLIENVTINGTLIVTGVSGDIDIRGTLDAAPVVPNAPVLMLRGGRADVRNSSGSGLSMNGLVLVDGDMTMMTSLSGAGPVVVLGDALINGGSSVSFTPTGAVAASPPEGFSTGVLPAIVDQSWERATD